MVGVARVDLLEEAVGPVDIVAVGSRADQLQVEAEARNPVGVAAEFRGIFFGSEVAAAPPAFVADSPVLHAERLGKTGRGAHVGERSAARG